MRTIKIILLIDFFLILLLFLMLIIHGAIVEVLFAINRKEIGTKFYEKFSFGTFSRPKERIKFLRNLVEENQGIKARIFFLKMIEWYKYEKICFILIFVLFVILFLLPIFLWGEVDCFRNGVLK